MRAARSAVEALAEFGEHHLFEAVEVVADDRLARGDRHLVAAADRQNAAAHGAEALRDRRRCRQLTTETVSAVRRSAWPVRMPKLPLSSSARTATTSARSIDDGGRAW